MKESGILQKILQKYDGSNQKCSDNSGKPLSMKTYFTAFIAIGLGIHSICLVDIDDNRNYQNLYGEKYQYF